MEGDGGEGDGGEGEGRVLRGRAKVMEGEVRLLECK